MDDLADAVRTRHLPTTKFSEGYDMDEVDVFLDSLILAREDGVGLAPLIENARFTPTRFREGYRMEPVDVFLAELRERFGGAAPRVAPASTPDPTPDPTPNPTPDATAMPDVVQVQRGWWERRRGRRD